MRKSVLILALSMPLAGPAAVLTVNTGALDLGDGVPGNGICDISTDPEAPSGDCTLRAAIEEANALAGLDEIRFAAGAMDLPVTGPPIEVTDTLVLAGSSHPAYAGQPVVFIRFGSQAFDGLVFTADGCAIDAIAMTGFPASALVLAGDDNRVSASWFGLERDGETAAPNGRGIGVTGDGNRIEGSLIAGNFLDGIKVTPFGGGDEAPEANEIRDNIIGLSATGVALGNGGIGSGVVDDRSQGTVIGPGNTLGGHFAAGIRVQGADGTEIFDNAIGFDRSSGRAGNFFAGILLELEARNVQIFGNDIDGNFGDGIHVNDANDVEIYGNAIGTRAVPDLRGGTPSTFGNAGFGIEVVAGERIVIGGDQPISGNVLAGNSAGGIRLGADENRTVLAARSRVQHNLIGWDPESDSRGNGVGPGILDEGADNLLGPGNQIRNHTGAGIQLLGRAFGADIQGPGSVVFGNQIGYDPDTLTAAPNFYGVHLLTAAGNRIGGGGKGERNVISGNSGDGVRVEMSVDNYVVTENTVSGNVIGLDDERKVPIPNTGFGINLVSGALDAVGEVAIPSRATEMNVISGNALGGVRVGPGSIGPTIIGNLIGLVAGGEAIGNGDGPGILGQGLSQFIGGGAIGGHAGAGISLENISAPGPAELAAEIVGPLEIGAYGVGSARQVPNADGIVIVDSSDVEIMGALRVQQTGASEPVVVGANRGHGLRIERSERIRVSGLIAGAPRGRTGYANGAGGIAVVDSIDVQFDLPVPNSGGVVFRNAAAGNDGPGISVSGTSARVDLTNLETGVNQGAGIDLVADGDGPDGLTANDGGDADSGPNGLQNAPRIDDVSVIDGTAEITVRLSSAPEMDYRLVLYGNVECDPIGPEGRFRLASAMVTTDGTGEAAHVFSEPSVRSAYTATAARLSPEGVETSEFSPCMAVSADGLGDFVWLDLDGDGIQGPGELGIEDIPVDLLDGNTLATLASTTTDADGRYLFTEVPPRPVSIAVRHPGPFSTANATGDDTLDSDVDASGLTAPFSYGGGLELDVDAGIDLGRLFRGDFEGDTPPG